jgi:Protein of unknown function TPD sequence-motif
MRNLILLLAVVLLAFLLNVHVVVVVAGFSVTAASPSSSSGAAPAAVGGRGFVVAVPPTATSSLVHPLDDVSSNNDQPPPNNRFAYTGVKRNIVWKDDSPPVSLAAEQALRRSGVLIRRGEFGRLSTDRVQEIAATCRALNMTLPQGLSMRKQIMLTEQAFSSAMLQKQSDALSAQLAAGDVTILDLAVQLHQSPVSIMRAIMSYRIHQSIPRLNRRHGKAIVKAIVNDELGRPHLDDFLDDHEQHQLQLAKASDVVGYVEQYDLSVQEAATAWEGALYRFLDDQNVSYLTQDELQTMGCTRTPDCLFLDDVTINNNDNSTAVPIRWIDCKSFYGSADAKMFTKDLIQQINRYDAFFDGRGAIVYRQGFSTVLSQRVAPALLLDRGPLKEYEEEETTTTTVYLDQ